MSAHPHEQYSENKPVAFTVPFILAAVTVLVIGLFLSLCDPSAHDHGAHGKAGAAHEKSADGHKHATDEEMQQYGDPKGPPAHPERPQGH